MDRREWRAPSEDASSGAASAGTTHRPSVWRRSTLLFIGALLSIALIAAACGGDDDDDDSGTLDSVVETPTPVVTATAGPSTPVPTDTPTPEPTPEPTPDEDPLGLNIEVNDLAAFVETYGYPSTATFATVRIPRFGVEAQVSAKSVGSGASVMPNPNGPAEVAWYDLTAWDGLGGTPGSGGNAIFSGHVDYAAPVAYAGEGVTFRGQAVFSKLPESRPGDVILVDYQGTTYTYQVAWVRQFSAGGDTDWAEIWSSDVGADAITLYTCGGEFDFGARSYDDRIVVRAHRIS